MDKVFLFLSALAYFLCRIAQYGLAISTDDWAILNASRRMLEGHFPVGDPNKTFELVVGLIPAFFDQPILFPIITAVFGAAICVAAYLLVLALTDNKPQSLCGWGVVLISPVLYWQVLNCNSVVYATCFLAVSLYCFTAGRFVKGCLLLMLAGLCRPEPFILAVPALVYAFMQWRKQLFATADMVRSAVILSLPPLWFLLFNFMKTGNPATSFTTVQHYTQTTLLDFDFLNFPPVFWNLLTTYYSNVFAVLVSAGGFILFLLRPRRLYFLYSYLLFTLLGYWILGALHFTLIERFLLPVHIYLVVFALILFNEAGKKLDTLPGRAKIFSRALLPFVFILLNINISAHGAVAHNLSYNADFDGDIPRVAAILRKELTDAGRKPIRILMTARRAAMLAYLLHDLEARYATIDFGTLLANKTDLRQEEIDFILYAPNDIYPLQSAFYAFDLLSDEGLEKQGLKIAGTTGISEHTRLLRVEKFADELEHSRLKLNDDAT